MKEIETTFIYALKDPRDGEIRYVGKANRPKGRLSAHVSKARQRRGGGSRKDRWIWALLWMNLKPELVILEEVPKAGWCMAERRWVRKLQTEGSRLLNISEGGVDLPGENGVRKKGVSRPEIGLFYRQRYLERRDVV